MRQQASRQASRQARRQARQRERRQVRWQVRRQVRQQVLRQECRQVRRWAWQQAEQPVLWQARRRGGTAGTPVAADVRIYFIARTPFGMLDALLRTRNARIGKCGVTLSIGGGVRNA